MNAIIEAAKLQGSAQISRRAWSTRGTTKVHLWELSTGGCIILRHEKGAGFQNPPNWMTPLSLYRRYAQNLI